MKINERHLCNFANSSTPIDREGYLMKKGEFSKNWQKRYFVLKGNLLFYFDKKVDKEPVGVIILEGCTVELVEHEELYSFKIQFHGEQSRCYILSAESQASMELWMRALATAGFDYMKLKVAELRKELEEMDDIPKLLAQAKEIEKLANDQQKSNSPVPPPRQKHHNPYYKQETVQMQRSPSGLPIDDSLSPTGTSSKISITFKELHNSYGRPILADYNRWRHTEKQLKEKREAANNLITF